MRCSSRYSAIDRALRVAMWRHGNRERRVKMHGFLTQAVMVAACAIWITIFSSGVLAIIDELRVEIEVSVTECPIRAEEGDTVEMSYNGTFEDGTSFDATAPGTTVEFTLGPDLIEGFNLGLYGGCVGETRRVFVPYSLGYGEEGAGEGVIPPRTDIIFLIVIYAIHKPDPNSTESMDHVTIVYENTTDIAIDEDTTAIDSDLIDFDDPNGDGDQSGDDDGVIIRRHRRPFWWYLQFLAIPVLIILLIVDAYYLYKIYFPHGRVKFYKVRDHEPNDLVNTL